MTSSPEIMNFMNECCACVATRKLLKGVMVLSDSPEIVSVSRIALLAVQAALVRLCDLI